MGLCLFKVLHFFCQMFHLFQGLCLFRPLERAFCVEVTSTVVFPWPIPHYDPISIQKQGGLMCSGIHPTFFVVA